MSPHGRRRPYVWERVAREVHAPYCPRCGERLLRLADVELPGVGRLRELYACSCAVDPVPYPACR